MRKGIAIVAIVGILQYRVFSKLWILESSVGSTPTSNIDTYQAGGLLNQCPGCELHLYGKPLQAIWEREVPLHEGYLPG
jgi:hypothetical protein